MKTLMSVNNFHPEVVEVRVCPDPVFIIGAPRSGTTILAESLAKHSHLWASDESEFLLDLFGRGHVDKAFDRTYALKGGSWLRAQSVSKDEFLSFIGLGINALFTSRSQGKRWIDQTNQYTLIVETLAKMFPRAQFIHALRDGRRAVHSTLHFRKRLPPELTRPDAHRVLPWIAAGRIAPWAADFSEACRVWCKYVEAALDFSDRYPSRCLTITNEKLTREPESSFAAIFRFLNVPFENQPVDFFRSTRINTSFPELYKKPGSIQRQTDPWSEWSSDQKKEFLEIAGPTMQKARLLIDVDFTPLTDEPHFPQPHGSDCHPRMRTIVESNVPKDAVILVISKGDDDLLESITANARHFPESEDGSYSGFHPADSAEAIMYLEKARSNGGEYLLIPWFSEWWLSHYDGFSSHLESRYQKVVRFEGCGVLYSLRNEGRGCVEPLHP
jgi:hypothetical protein